MARGSANFGFKTEGADSRMTDIWNTLMRCSEGFSPPPLNFGGKSDHVSTRIDAVRNRVFQIFVRLPEMTSGVQFHPHDSVGAKGHKHPIKSVPDICHTPVTTHQHQRRTVQNALREKLRTRPQKPRRKAVKSCRRPQQHRIRRPRPEHRVVPFQTRKPPHSRARGTGWR